MVNDWLTPTTPILRSGPGPTIKSRSAPLAGVAESRVGQTGKAARHYRAALEIALALRDKGRLAPVDAWLVGDLEARLARVSQPPAR